MSANDVRLTSQKPLENDAQETCFSDTDAFLPKKKVKDDGDIESSSAKEVTADDDKDQFRGLTREELDAIASDPTWVKIRWVLFLLLLIGWAAMLIIAIIVVVLYPKCPPNPNLVWYQDGVAYKTLASKFQDSNNDGYGDLAGIEKQLQHFEDLYVKSVWISDAVDQNDQNQTLSTVGSIADFKNLTTAFKKKGIRVVIYLDLKADTIDKTVDDLVRTWASPDRGAEGFVLSPMAGVSDKDFVTAVERLQKLLDDEFNRKDDRNRVIIGGKGVSKNASLALSVSVSMPENTCATWECRLRTIAVLGKANSMATEYELTNSKTHLKKNKEALKRTGPWVVQQNSVCADKIGEAQCNLLLQLTLPGTPNVMYGDEIGMFGSSRGHMIWDDSITHGFTLNQSWTNPGALVRSVLAQKSVGFQEPSAYTLFKDLAAARMEHPSLQWGDFVPLDFGNGVVAYVRNATGFAPVVVATNLGEGKAGSLTWGDYSMGEVLVSSYMGELEEKVGLDAVYLPWNSVFVAAMSIPPKEK